MLPRKKVRQLSCGTQLAFVRRSEHQKPWKPLSCAYGYAACEQVSQTRFQPSRALQWAQIRSLQPRQTRSRLQQPLLVRFPLRSGPLLQQRQTCDACAWRLSCGPQASWEPLMQSPPPHPQVQQVHQLQTWAHPPQEPSPQARHSQRQPS